MRIHFISRKTLSVVALAAVALLAIILPGGRRRGQAQVYECQHPLVTGQEAVNPKGITPKEACKVVLSLGKYLSKTGEHPKSSTNARTRPRRRPGRPVLLMDEFEGWKLKLNELQLLHAQTGTVLPRHRLRTSPSTATDRRDPTAPMKAGPMQRARRGALAALICAAVAVGAGAASAESRAEPSIPPNGGTFAGPAPIGCTSHPGRIETSGPSARRRIALTFDDGPSSIQTPAILEILNSFGAQATFFEEGRHVAGREELMREILASGDEIGNHSFDHPHYPGFGELASTDRWIHRATGFEPCLFRPPYGLLDSTVDSAALGNHLETILWTFDAGDDHPSLRPPGSKPTSSPPPTPARSSSCTTAATTRRRSAPCPASSKACSGAASNSSPSQRCSATASSTRASGPGRSGTSARGSGHRPDPGSDRRRS